MHAPSTAPLASSLEIENRSPRSNRQVCAYTAIVACVAVVAFCAGKVDPFFQVQFIGFATGPSAPTGTTRTAPVEASAMDEILSQLNPKGTRKSKGPKVDFMAQESSEEGGAFPQYGDCSTYCCRRKALAGAIGAAAMTAGGFPALAAGSAKVGAGDDTGLLGFVPKSVKICKGDKITWTSGKAAPHNILFDEENVPGGVDAKALGQPDGEYLNEEGDTFSQTFSVAGKYNYFCAPHAGAGMQGDITVE
jgi:plastocyanin